MLLCCYAVMPLCSCAPTNDDNATLMTCSVFKTALCGLHSKTRSAGALNISVSWRLKCYYISAQPVNLDRLVQRFRLFCRYLRTVKHRGTAERARTPACFYRNNVDENTQSKRV